MAKLHQPGFDQYPKEDENTSIVVTEDGVAHAGSARDIEEELRVRTGKLVEDLKKETRNVGADLLYLTGVSSDLNYEDLEPKEEPKSRKEKSEYFHRFNKDMHGEKPRRSHHTKSKGKK